VVGRATWFILPYDAIKEGFASMFHGAPIPEAMASTRAENEMTNSANFDGTNLTVEQQLSFGNQNSTEEKFGIYDTSGGDDLIGNADVTAAGDGILGYNSESVDSIPTLKPYQLEFVQFNQGNPTAIIPGTNGMTVGQLATLNNNNQNAGVATTYIDNEGHTVHANSSECANLASSNQSQSGGNGLLGTTTDVVTAGEGNVVGNVNQIGSIYTTGTTATDDNVMDTRSDLPAGITVHPVTSQLVDGDGLVVDQNGEPIYYADVLDTGWGILRDSTAGKTFEKVIKLPMATYNKALSIWDDIRNPDISATEIVTGLGLDAAGSAGGLVLNSMGLTDAEKERAIRNIKKDIAEGIINKGNLTEEKFNAYFTEAQDTNSEEIITTTITTADQGNETDVDKLENKIDIEVGTEGSGNTAIGDSVTEELNNIATGAGQAKDAVVDKTKQGAVFLSNWWKNSNSTNQTPSYNEFTSNPKRYEGFELVDGKVVPVGGNITGNASGNNMSSDKKDTATVNVTALSGGNENAGGLTIKDINGNDCNLTSDQAKQYTDLSNFANHVSTTGTTQGSLHLGMEGDVTPGFNNVTNSDLKAFTNPELRINPDGLFTVVEAGAAFEADPNVIVDTIVKPDLVVADDTDVTFEDRAEQEDIDGLTSAPVINESDATGSEKEGVIVTNLGEDNKGLMPAEEGAKAVASNVATKTKPTYWSPFDHPSTVNSHAQTGSQGFDPFNYGQGPASIPSSDLYGSDYFQGASTKANANNTVIDSGQEANIATGTVPNNVTNIGDGSTHLGNANQGYSSVFGNKGDSIITP
ncbi:MAG: hypothetical protein U9Q72_00165, partial [Patescibacteria group bacterium]|nr:hypothetical protein [Patescibacteria group bacterium]